MNTFVIDEAMYSTIYTMFRNLTKLSKIGNVLFELFCRDKLLNF